MSPLLTTVTDRRHLSPWRHGIAGEQSGRACGRRTIGKPYIWSPSPHWDSYTVFVGRYVWGLPIYWLELQLQDRYYNYRFHLVNNYSPDSAGVSAWNSLLPFNLTSCVRACYSIRTSYEKASRRLESLSSKCVIAMTTARSHLRFNMTLGSL